MDDDDAAGTGADDLTSGTARVSPSPSSIGMLRRRVRKFSQIMSNVNTSSLNHTMPQRLTVASVAERRSSTSNIILTYQIHPALWYSKYSSNTLPHTSICVCMLILHCTHLHMHVHAHIHTAHACTHARTHTHAHAETDTERDTHTHTHTRRHTHTHTHYTMTKQWTTLQHIAKQTDRQVADRQTNRQTQITYCETHIRW